MRDRADIEHEHDGCYGEKYGLHDEKRRAELLFEMLLDIRDQNARIERARHADAAEDEVSADDLKGWITIDDNDLDRHVAMNVPGGIVFQSIFLTLDSDVKSATSVFVPGIRARRIINGGSVLEPLKTKE